ncbi:hypothetical protein PSTT_04839, partial [Puccinia striiformis]
NSGGPQAPLPILTNPCAERWLVPSREWIPSTDSREEFKQDIPRIYHSKNELEAHCKFAPAPWACLFYKDVQIQPEPTSSIQQPTQPVSTDLPGLSYEAMPQEYERGSTNASGAQSDTECSRRRKTVRDGIAVPSRAGPSNRHQVPKSLVMYRFPDFAVEDEGFFREVHGGWACKYPACMKRWGLEARRDNMLAHWVTHSEDTPFACNVEEFHPPAYGQEPCSRIHKRLNELKKHVQNDHNVQVWQKGFSRTQTFAEMDLDDTRLRTQGRQRR